MTRTPRNSRNTLSNAVTVLQIHDAYAAWLKKDGLDKDMREFIEAQIAKLKEEFPQLKQWRK